MISIGLPRAPRSRRNRPYGRFFCAWRLVHASPPVGAASCRERAATQPRNFAPCPRSWGCCAALSRHKAAPTKNMQAWRLRVRFTPSPLRLSPFPVVHFPNILPTLFKPLRWSGSASSLDPSLPNQRPALTGRPEATNATAGFMAVVRGALSSAPGSYASSVCQPTYCRHPLV